MNRPDSSSDARLAARELRVAAYREWLLYVGLIAAFGLLREGANYTGIPIQYRYAAVVDRMLGMGTAPTVRLQALRSPFLDWTAITIWLTFFVFPHAVAWVLYRRGKLRPYSRALAVFLCCALVVHIVLPTAPPWLVAAHGDMPTVHRVLRVWGEQISPAVYAAGNATAGSNPVAAMPSVHVGWVTVAALAVDAPLSLSLAYAFVMTLALTYLGEHFLLDGLIGAALALTAVAAQRRWLSGARGSLGRTT